MDWQIQETKAPDEMVVLKGDFDLYEGPRFAAEMIGHIREGHHHVVLDLAGVDYLDSCGVGIIIKLLQQIRAVSGTLRFQGIHGTPRRVLEMSNVIKLLEEIDTPNGEH